MRGWINNAVNFYLDAKSFKTQRQLVVIESDDWGSLRTKDKATRAKLNAIHPRIKTDAYCQLDSIASSQDLELLFEILGSVRDHKNNPACITPNICTANPDFEKIKQHDFDAFFYIPFTQTLKEYATTQDLFSLWKKGISEKVFSPQLHGREHLHALAWLTELRSGQKELIRAFENETWGIPYQAIHTQKRKNVQAALDRYGYKNEESYHQAWVKEAAEIFESSFGYAATSFIAPAFTWHSTIHPTLVQAKIESVQGIKLQYQPNLSKGKGYQRKPHFLGEIDQKSGVLHAPRNAFFEPFMNPEKDWVDSCLKEIKTAFRKNNPAIIGAHRINFVGRLDENHRDRNLKQFKALLQQILQHYPQVEFIDSATLAQIIKTAEPSTSQRETNTNPQRGDNLFPVKSKFSHNTPPSSAEGLVLPTFLIVGAQKCGTTSLHEVLDQHPEVSMSKTKEINFFTSTEKLNKGLSYYSSFFVKTPHTKAIGESSPGYLCYPEVHQQIFNHLGEIKIVIILRDPIKRAFSQYWDNRRQLKEKLTTDEIIENYLEASYSPHRKGYFSRGVYYPDVKKYIQQFGRANVHVIIFEELVRNQQQELQHLYRFLEIDKNKGLQNLPPASNASMSWDNPIYDFFLKHPKATPLIPSKMRKLLFFGQMKKFKYQIPHDEKLEKLISFYSPWNRKLAELVNNQLKYWI